MTKGIKLSAFIAKFLGKPKVSPAKEQKLARDYDEARKAVKK